MASRLFVFGVAGIALAAMGTYGLVSYTVAQSTREIGIRMALGASGGSVIRVFLSRGMRLGAAGAVLGLVAALGASRLLGSLLFGVSTTDLSSFGLHPPSSSPASRWPRSFRPGARRERIRYGRCGITRGSCARGSPEGSRPGGDSEIG